MAGIFQGTRIREKKAIQYQGKPLVFNPHCRPNDMDSALSAHNFVWANWLSEENKKIVTARWLGKLIGELTELKPWRKKAAKKIFDRHLQNINEVQSAIAIRRARLSEPKTFESFFKLFNHDYAKTKIGPYFPSFIQRNEQTLSLINELVETGTLVESRNLKIPKPVYAEYLSNLTMDDKIIFRRKVTEVQSLLNWGSLWIQFFTDLGVTKFDQIEPSQISGYPVWRSKRKKSGWADKPISSEAYKRELSYFKKVYALAVQNNRATLLNKAQIDEIKPIVIGAKKKNENDEIQKPIPIQKILDLLAFCRSFIQQKSDTPKDIRDKKFSKQNYFGCLFLLLTGCRPSEINHLLLSPDKDKVLITEGKTGNAKRSIPVSATLLKILQDPDFKEFKGKIADRLCQWLERHKFEGITPYRFRHTVATIKMTLALTPRQMIAYEMGHSNSAFTEEKYAEMGTYLDFGKIELLNFWNWLQNDYFAIPEKSDFRLP